MADIGTITGIEIGKNKEGTADVRLLQVWISEESDVQTVEHFRQPGDDTSPMIGDQVVIFDIGESWKIAVCVDDLVPPTSAEGVKHIYSRDAAGAIAAFIKLLVNKNIELNGVSVQITGSTDIQLNGSADTAVRFSKLKETIDELQSDIALLKAAFTAWAPVVAGDGGGKLQAAAAAWAAAPLIKVIDPAEVTDVKVSG